MGLEEFYLYCPTCHHQHVFSRPLATCPKCGSDWLQGDFRLEEATKDWPAALEGRPSTLWRYRELLPIYDDENIVSLGEGWTPLIRAENLGLMLGQSNLFIKDERQNPTGSFKDRQASVFTSMLKEAGITEAVVASTGNVAIAYSAYCARAGIKLWTFITSLVPADKMREIALYGGELVKVSSTYDQTKKVASQFARSKGLHVDQGAKSIAAKESMKTVALEICEQLPLALEGTGNPTTQGSKGKWKAPDWYLQAVSGGLGPVGVQIGFEQLFQVGMIDKIPKMAHIQAAGCAPMVLAFEQGKNVADPVLSPKTNITTLATGTPGQAYTCLKGKVDKYGGFFTSVTDDEAFRALHVLAKMEGLSVEPATAVAFAGLFKLVRDGVISPDETGVINCSGHTFPVEKQILGDTWGKEVADQDTRKPKEGLISALKHLDTRVTRIALIEDNPDAARLMRRILQARGEFIIDEAHDGAMGLEMVKVHPPDLIVLDLMMPGLDGFQLLNELKENESLASVPVVVVSAKTLTEDESNQLQAQTDGFLQKGTFTDEELVDSIMTHLGDS